MLYIRKTMEICIGIIVIALVLVVIFQLVEIKRKLGGTTGSGEVPDSIIQSIDKLINQVRGIIK